MAPAVTDAGASNAKSLMVMTACEAEDEGVLADPDMEALGDWAVAADAGGAASVGAGLLPDDDPHAAVSATTATQTRPSKPWGVMNLVIVRRADIVDSW
ncbi:MAG: hypothetical protein HHJ10_05840 [Cellulomonas sp.]|nr:hypothetical protein [Cellulomonas sp.]